MSNNYNYQRTRFIKSISHLKYLPTYGIEIAFIGSSNTGKSSILNTITQQKNLAKTSKTAGRTRFINIFEIKDGIRLVDLPGYGYAKVPKFIQHKWQNIVNEYLQTRTCLKGLIISMDIRHPLKDMDIKIIKWAITMHIPILILLTKADKLTYNKQKNQAIVVSNKLKLIDNVTNDVQVVNFSSLKRIGVDKLQFKLDEWFKIHNI
ncbi:putative GTP-binding protein EngB [Candidatus Arsenophonus lipoptenae]|uniref:Probable GTP-binding protein EngB n=1 Tax=Candidatus Arsenophonus lipoptenae TaxID=634113 RepID=A0A0X9VII5_9GAMM|nr:putative GTP-binding protein EngB [Candidatus Arsenophonus lipoptenae]